ncbi:variable large family protein (plasmid) [Borrelia nietonii YOR]|nr:variable large family protein [Borrelia nietonii YOR]UPA10115.1 variable large family protein [Borrelia nietonii YOR]UPA10209.1 variable large family protein [Borrelia nietonii YOR]
MEVGRSAENAFYSFLELLSDTLGFTAKSTTKKEDVGGYFNSLGDKLGKASEELEQIVKNSETELDKGGLNKGIKDAVDTAKATLSKLKGHLESLGQVGDTNVIGYANNVQGTGTASDDAQLKEMFRALKGIVEIATDVGVKALQAGATTLTVNGVDNKDGAKILATSGGNPSATDAGKAAIILAAVSGEEILDSIVRSGESDAALTANADENTTSLKFAKGGSDAHLSNSANPKAAAVAGGIALRSLVKTGKLGAGAAANNAGGEKEVQGIGVTAVNKLLVAVEDIIKKTAKNVLKTAKEKMDEARSPKSTDQQ